MLFIAKLSKYNKLEVNSALFKIVAVGTEITDQDGKIAVIAPLAPPMTLITRYKSDTISKKEFLKEYREYLESEAGRSIMLNILEAIDRKIKGLFFVCSDAEWELGYLKYLSKYISEITGLEFLDAEDGIKDINKRLKNVEKENKKESKKTRKKALAHFIESELNVSLEMSIDGIDYLNRERKHFSIDQTVIALIHSGVIIAAPEADNDEEDENAYKLTSDKVLIDEAKKKTLLKAIDNFSSTKKGAKLVEKVAEMNKVKVSKLDKKDNAEIITFILDLYAEILSKRFYSENQDYSKPDKDEKKSGKKSGKKDKDADKKKDKKKEKSIYSETGKFLIGERK